MSTLTVAWMITPALLSTVAMGQTKIEVRGLETEGVALIPSGSTEFTRLLNDLVPLPADRDVLARVIPYAAFAVNRSGRAIQQLRMRYDFTWYFSGGPIHYTSTSASRSKVHLPSGAARFISPLHSINPGVNTRRLAPATHAGFRDAIDKGIGTLEKAVGAIVLSVDTVVFNDGTLVGPDRTNLYDEIMGRHRAEVDFKTEVLSKRADHLDHFLFSWAGRARLTLRSDGANSGEVAYSNRMQGLAAEFSRLATDVGGEKARATLSILPNTQAVRRVSERK